MNKQSSQFMSCSPTTLLLAGVWFGLLTGIVEVAAFLVRRHILGRFNRLGHDILWMAPLLNVLLFGAIGLGFFLIARWRRDVPLVRAAISSYVFLSAMTVLLMYYPLHFSAKLALAGGLAAQIGRLSVRWPEWPRLLHVTLAWPVVLWRWLSSLLGRSPARLQAARLALTRRDFLVGTSATLGVLVTGARGPSWLGEWYGVRQLPAAQAGAPNVLLLVLDTVRAASMSLYGYPRETTAVLTGFADRGLAFTRAFAPSSWTGATHASIFTGRHPHELSTDWETPLDATHPTLAEVLSGHGYATAAFAANTEYCSYEGGLHRGFHHYEDYPVNFGQFVSSSRLANHVSLIDAIARQRRFEILGRKRAVDVSSHFMSWLAGHNERPFFAFLNYYDAHAPYLPPSPFDTRFGPSGERPNPRLAFGWEWSAEQIRAEQNAYDGAIAYLDQQVGCLLAELERRGLLHNTLVIVTSDHGEQFGEHGLMGHANSLYAQVLHVPLLMVWPGGISEKRTIHQPISLRNLAATVLDLLGIENTTLPGRSLAPLWQHPASTHQQSAEPILSEIKRGDRVPDHFRNSRGDMRSLITDNLHYIKDGDGREELYDLDSDPAEERNLAADSERAAGLDSVRQILERVQGST